MMCHLLTSFPKALPPHRDGRQNSGSAIICAVHGRPQKNSATTSSIKFWAQHCRRRAWAALPQNYAYTGFLRGQAAPGERAAAEIAQVRALEQTGAALPVVILANLEQSAARNLFLRLLAFWPQGAPLVVQRSNNAFVADPHRPEVLVVGPAPLEELFTYATIVVHSGNVATTSAALHVGRPQIIFPQSADETWWAQATEKLGVSKILPAETWAASLQNTLETTLRDVKIMRQVADCATRLRAEDGAAATVRALEKL
jgi:predicted glycosyltransferase